MGSGPYVILVRICHLRAEWPFVHCIRGCRLGFICILLDDPIMYWLLHAASKWYMSQEQLPDGLVPRGKAYLAGWAYVLSRDVAEDLVHLVGSYALQPDTRPGELGSRHFLYDLFVMHYMYSKQCCFCSKLTMHCIHCWLFLQRGFRHCSGRTSWSGCWLLRS